MCKSFGYKERMTKKQFDEMQKFEQKVSIEVITKTGANRKPTLELNTEMKEEL